MKILVTPTTFTPKLKSLAIEKLRSFASDLTFNPHGRPLTEDELIPLLEGCEGCIAGVDYFGARVMENSKTLKIISRYGTGFDRVDLAAAKANNIVVTNTPGVNSRAVADLAFGLLLCLARKIHLLDRETRNGQWSRSTGIELHGKTLGILGLGFVGKEMAKRAAGFSMKINAYDPLLDKNFAGVNGIISVDFDTLICSSDFLSLHLPLNNETKNIISGELMLKMKKGAVIINTARGGLVDESAAYGLLASGQLGGMGLDVFETEPPEKSPLFNLENVVLTPHTAAHTAEAAAAMADMSVQNLIDVLSCNACPYIL